MILKVSQLVRQMELHDMSVAEKLLKNCGKKR